MVHLTLTNEEAETVHAIMHHLLKQAQDDLERYKEPVAKHLERSSGAKKKIFDVLKVLAKEEGSNIYLDFEKQRIDKLKIAKHIEQNAESILEKLGLCG